MKLVAVETFVVPVPKPYCGGQYWFFLKLTTDDGLVGWGEAVAHKAFWGMGNSFKQLANDIFDRWLKGNDAMQRTHLTKKIYRELLSSHGGVLGFSMLSAFDIALWDIAGKALNAPVYQLLGGKYREKIRSYSYLCRPEYSETKKNYYPLWSDPEALAERAIEMVEEGFTALKYDPLRYLVVKGTELPTPYNLRLEDLKVIENTMRALHDAVGGRCDILLGTHGQTMTNAAIRIGKLIEPYDPLWFEEPVPPENAREMAKVRESTRVPIASGERLCGIHDFIDVLEAGAISIAQPDLGTCGGITECMKIAALCESYYVDMAPHVWGGPVITAAALQIDTAIPNFLIQESIYKSEHFTTQILTHSLGWDEGYFTPLERPGIGVEFDEKELAKYCG